MMNFDPMALTLLLPLLGALIVGTTGRHLGKMGSAAVASGAVGLSFLIVLSNVLKEFAVGGVSRQITLWEWMTLPGGAEATTSLSFGLYIDPLSLTLMSVITGVGFLIHWFSSEYMEHDADVPRYFTLLNLFVAAMTFLVLADNYATLIIGWGGVGFASFALIGFWREKPSAAAASKKAFVMNVIGDVGLMVAVFILYWQMGTLDFQTLFHSGVPSLSKDFATEAWVMAFVLGLMVAAYAKSAQLPLHTWLPDAMEGPTPVSALIHAATMVTAGVYLLIRSGPFLQLVPDVGQAIGYFGAVTALFAACCAMVQTDLKRVLAYSTMSQLGYMFMAVGVGAYGAALFHLVTHAFFKALLFLSAGIVIHAAHGEQDMRRLGGIGKQMPMTAVFFGVGSLALAGFPLTAGFFSKEAILGAVHHHPGGTPIFLVGALVAVMTALYIGRAYFLTFFGPSKIESPHLPGAPTTLSCLILTILALGAGFAHSGLQSFLDPTMALSRYQIEPGATSAPALILSGLVILALLLAYHLFGKGEPDRFGGEGSTLVFLRTGFGFDQFYAFLSRSVVLMGQLTARGSDTYFQEKIPTFVGRSFHSLGVLMRQIQSGQTRQYMVSLTISTVILVLFTLVLQGGRPQ